MDIGKEIKKLKKDFRKNPTYKNLIELKILIKEFYLEKNFDDDDLEKRKKELQKEFRYNSYSIFLSFSSGIVLMGLTLFVDNIINMISPDKNSELYISKLMIGLSIFIGYFFYLIFRTKKLHNKYFDDIANFEEEIVSNIIKAKYEENLMKN